MKENTGYFIANVAEEIAKIEKRNEKPARGKKKTGNDSAILERELKYGDSGIIRRRDEKER